MTASSSDTIGMFLLWTTISIMGVEPVYWIVDNATTIRIKVANTMLKTSVTMYTSSVASLLGAETDDQSAKGQ